jgi:hypothetical protein
MHGYYQAHRRPRAMAHRVALCALCGGTPRAHSPVEHEYIIGRAWRAVVAEQVPTWQEVVRWHAQ